MQQDVEINEYDLASDEARTRRAAEYLHRKEMERIESEEQWTKTVVNVAITAVVASVLAVAAMAIHAYITFNS